MKRKEDTGNANTSGGNKGKLLFCFGKAGVYRIVFLGSRCLLYRQPPDGRHFGSDFNYNEFRNRAAMMFHNKVDIEGLPIKKGVYEILKYLSESTYKIGLASSSSTESIHKNLKRADITDYFQVIVGGDIF